LQFLLDGAPSGGVFEVVYDPQADAYVFDFAQTGLDPDANLGVDAWLSADHSPSPVNAMVTGP
jgi:hypothetical protein